MFLETFLAQFLFFTIGGFAEPQLVLYSEQSRQGQVVFLGDSITEYWMREGVETWNTYYAPIGAVNKGVAGDTTADTIRRISADGIINNLNAKLAVLKIGTNDLNHGTGDNDTISNIAAIISLIRDKNPGVKILLLGILPRTPAELHMRAGNINNQISLYAKAPDVWFLDMKDAFSRDWGMIFKELYVDGLHLGPQGYVRWAETMNPLFFEILDQSKKLKLAHNELLILT